jgi:hypothetical protein
MGYLAMGDSLYGSGLAIPDKTRGNHTSLTERLSCFRHEVTVEHVCEGASFRVVSRVPYSLYMVTCESSPICIHLRMSANQ